MVAPIIGQGSCQVCGKPINLRKGFDVKYCSDGCSTEAHRRRSPTYRERQAIARRKFRRRKRTIQAAFKLAYAAIELRQLAKGGEK